MPKDVLINILHKGLYIDLTAVFLAYLLNWLVNMKLCLRLIGVKVEIQKLFPWILALSATCLVGKQFLPMLFFGLLVLVMFALIIKLLTRTVILKAFWAALYVQFFMLASDVIIGQTILTFCKGDTIRFLTQTVNGVIVGTFIEMFFPAIALFVCSFYDITLIPPIKKRITKSEFLGVLLFGFLVLATYNLTVMFLTFMPYVPSYMLVRISIIQLAILGCIAVVNITSYTNTKKQRENDFKVFEEEKRDLISKSEEDQAKIKDLTKINNEITRESIENKKLLGLVLKQISDKQVIGDEIIDQLKAHAIPADDSAEFKFSSAEIEIINLIAEGYSNVEVGQITHRSEGTVRNMVSKILAKAKVENRTELSCWAAANKLIRKK